MIQLRSEEGRASLLDVATVLVLVLALVLLVGPGSRFADALGKRQADRQLARRISQSWDSVISAAARLYAGSGEPEVVEFVDYQCPFCRQIGPAVDSLVALGVRVGVVHFPLAIHPPAKDAAIGALCAERAGYLGVVHERFLTTEEWIDGSPVEFAALLGSLDQRVEFEACIASSTGVRALAAHLDLAREIGISATPTFVSRRAMFRGLPTTESLLRFARDQ